MPHLLSLPNELLEEIVGLLVPSFPRDCSEHRYWGIGPGETPHIKDLSSLCLTCKQLELVVRPHLFKIVVITYPTRMIRLFRTLIENPSIRKMVRTISICCTFSFGDEMVDPFSPRETFLDENPELSLKMKWDPDTMEPYAAAVFRAVELDRDEYKEFTEDELEALNEGSYWMAIPSFSERANYEERLMESLAAGLMALSLGLERFIIRRENNDSDDHFQEAIASLVKHPDTQDHVLENVPKLEFWKSRSNPFGFQISPSDDFWNSLIQLPTIKEFYDDGKLKLKPFQLFD
ncbi:hypothetical protein TWF694_008182 [Orbilia ellipsospora]|uniref:F-box domain-containing protein n=1 Tax=Orbilia ellipsospora TaxID=2528407 RepID=A0AAV9XGQ6_9PEZI